MKQIMKANKIWHDASEKPKDEDVNADAEYLVQTKAGYFKATIYSPREWRNAVRWACINDLLNLQEEPVSEDLEEAAYNLAKRYNFEKGIAEEDVVAILKAGAHWKEQQMIEKAVDAEVTYGKSLAIPALGIVLDKNNMDFGDRVKVIIIKDE